MDEVGTMVSQPARETMTDHLHHDHHHVHDNQAQPADVRTRDQAQRPVTSRSAASRRAQA
jgi:hypothetical protein